MGGKNGRAGQATDDNIIQRMRGACWINKATQKHTLTISGVHRNFFRVRGFNKFSFGQRTDRTGIWGRSPLVRGSGGSCNLVQEISFHIVKFS